MQTNALCMNVTRPRTVVKLMQSDSLITGASARCKAAPMRALCLSTSQAFWCGALYFKVIWLYIAQSSTSLPLIPISPSSVKVCIPPNTLTHAREIPSNKSFVDLLAVLKHADHLMQQSIMWMIGTPCDPPSPGSSLLW